MHYVLPLAAALVTAAAAQSPGSFVAGARGNRLAGRHDKVAKRFGRRDSQLGDFNVESVLADASAEAASLVADATAEAASLAADATAWLARRGPAASASAFTGTKGNRKLGTRSLTPIQGPTAAPAKRLARRETLDADADADASASAAALIASYAPQVAAALGQPVASVVAKVPEVLEAEGGGVRERRAGVTEYFTEWTTEWSTAWSVGGGAGTGTGTGTAEAAAETGATGCDTSAEGGETVWSTGWTTQTKTHAGKQAASTRASKAAKSTATHAAATTTQAAATASRSVATTTSSAAASATTSAASDDGLCAQSNVKPASLAAHNALRGHYGAADLVWNATLADLATTWANNCVWEDGGGTAVGAGSNIAAESGTGGNTTSQIQMWSSETSEYDASDPQYSHFTQMVWKATTSIGCAMTSCSDGISELSYSGNFLVCECYPAGNVYPASNFLVNVGTYTA